MSRLGQLLWTDRSRKGKAAVVLAGLIGLFIVIGVLAPAPDENPASTVAGDEAASENTTSAEDTPTEEEPPPPPPPVVASITDGDTFRLRNGERVRLIQIDAPESGGDCYGAQAARTLRRLIPPGTEVRLVADPRLDKRDRFDRLLRYVYRGDRNLNLELVRRGAASVWFFQGERGRFATRLVRTARESRFARRGLWGACEATEFNPLAAVRTAKPPPPPELVEEEPEPEPVANCHPSYTGACLDPNASDYDCLGGEGDGPEYTGYVQVVGPDEYELDADGDGGGCEDS